AGSDCAFMEQRMPEHTDLTPRLAHPDHLFLGGRWAPPSTSARLKLVNPVSEQPFFEGAEACRADVDAAVAAAPKAFDEGPWPRRHVSERAAKMRALAQALGRRAKALELATTAQIGLPVKHSIGSTAGPIALLNYYADLALNSSFEEVRASGGSVSKVA